MNRKAVFRAALAAEVILAGCSTIPPVASPSTSTAEATSSTIASNTAATTGTAAAPPAQASVGQISDLAELAAKVCDWSGPEYGQHNSTSEEVAVVYGNPDAHTSPIASDELDCSSSHGVLNLMLFNPPYTIEGYWDFILQARGELAADLGNSATDPNDLTDVKALTIVGSNWMVAVQGTPTVVAEVRAILLP